MSGFKKVPLQNNRLKLSSINSQIIKKSRKPDIQLINELDVDGGIKHVISNLLPNIEKIRSSGLEKNVKTALIADLLNNAELSVVPPINNVPYRPSSPPLRKPRYSSTPAKAREVTPFKTVPEELFEYSGEENELLKYFPEFHNKKYEVVDKQGDAYPSSDINRVLSFLNKSNTGRDKKGPIGTPAVLESIGQLGYKLQHLANYIRNTHAIERLENIRKRLEEKSLTEKKKKKKKKNLDQFGSGWTSLKIRY